MWGKKGSREIQAQFDSDEERRSVFDMLISLAGYSMKTKDLLKQCDRVV